MSKKLFVDPDRSLRLQHRRILQSDIALFLDRHEALETPALWMSKPQCASVGLAYLGGGTPPIGLLVAAWRDQHLTLPCVCGGTTYLWFASGSPLSGRHSLTGACPSCGALSQPKLTGTRKNVGGLVGPVLMRYDRGLFTKEDDRAVPFELLPAILRGEQFA